MDTLFVKAIHEGVAAVHEASIRESETAGTTLCSLFLIPIDHQKQMHDILQSSTAPATTEPWQPPQADVAAADLGLINTTDCGRSYKVMCANVGDSRCVMVGCSAEPAPAVSSDFESNLRSSYVSSIFSPKKNDSDNVLPNASAHISRGLNVFPWRRTSTVQIISLYL